MDSNETVRPQDLRHNRLTTTIKMVDTGYGNQKFPHILFTVLSRLAGALVAVLSLRITMWAHDVEMREPYLALIIIVALMALMLFPGRRQSTSIIQHRVWGISVSIVGRWCLLIAILLLLGYVTKSSSTYSRRVVLSWLVATPLLLIFVQAALELLISRSRLSTRNARRVVIAGASELGHKLASKIKSSPLLGMDIDGFFDDRGVERLGNSSSFPLLGKLNELPDYVRKHSTDVIFFVLPIRNIQRVTDLIDNLHDTTASIYFVPDVFVFDLIQCRTSDIGGLPIVALCETPFYGTQSVVKALSDYIIASIVLILISPLLISIALAIKFTSPGRVIFKQRRYGLDGRDIVVYKFRSMTVSEDSGIVTQATQHDHRVTRVGAFLRKYSLDELPQFINVLQGRMSVVGPRPHAIVHNEEYRVLIKGYMLRHKVNPGITGLAQVMGCRGETRTVDAMQKRVEYDLEYLRNWSLALDLRIIFRTIRVVLNDKMAY